MAMPGVALLAALLLAFSASQAGPLQSSSGDDYASQLTRDKDAAEEAQRLKAAQGTPNLKDRLQDSGGRPMADLLEKLSPLTGGLQPWLYRDARGLRELIRREMESLRTKLSPYLDEGSHQVGQALQALRCRLMPVVEELTNQVSLHAKELNRHVGLDLSVASPSLDVMDEVQTFGGKMALLVDHANAALRPYVERLVSETRHGVDELRVQLGPPVQEFAETLTRNAEELRANMESSLEHLKAHLGLSSSGQRRRHLGQDAGADVDEMGQDVREIIEAFRRDAFLQTESFARALEKEMGETGLKPAPPPLYWGDVQENPPPLEDLPTRLDSLWKDIFQGLKEPMGSTS